MSNLTSVTLIGGIPNSGTGSVSTLDGLMQSGMAPYQATPVAGSQFGLTCASSTSLTVPAGALQAIVSIEGGSVRYTHDGVTTPTSTVGHLLTSGTFEPFYGAAILANLKFIQASGTVTLNVSYLK